MSENWELVNRPISFTDFIHNYLFLIRLRQLRDVSYNYRESHQFNPNHQLHHPLLCSNDVRTDNESTDNVFIRCLKDLESNFLKYKETYKNTKGYCNCF